MSQQGRLAFVGWAKEDGRESVSGIQHQLNFQNSLIRSILSDALSITLHPQSHPHPSHRPTTSRTTALEDSLEPEIHFPPPNQILDLTGEGAHRGLGLFMSPGFSTSPGEWENGKSSEES